MEWFVLCLRVLYPCRPSEGLIMPGQHSKKGEPLMSKRILIVDDSVTVLQVLKLTLTNAGYEVLEAGDGQDALGKLNGEKVDMMITDLNMPKLDGIGLIKEVRKRPDYRFVPIVMLTTESAGDKKVEGKAAGASGWIVKPFKPEQLLKVVKMVLG
jgi:two-component system chemotaxis response regulator CheY